MILAQRIKIMHKLGIGQVIVFTPLLSQKFSTLMQYMSVSHGFSTISGMECGGGCKANKEKMVTLTRLINELWRCSSIDINVNE